MSFSIVIPTMWRSDRIVGMLDQFELCDEIDEVIIIDNDWANKPDIEFGPKVKYLKQDENIFVNPAWNLGVSLAANDRVCLLNDDVTFNVRSLFSQMSMCFDRFKRVGVNARSYHLEDNDYFELGIVEEAQTRFGWGCCIFVSKENWVDIPSGLKIWYGDNWIIRNNKAYSFIFPIATDMSTTARSGVSTITETIRKDQKCWKTYEPNWVFNTSI